MYTTPLLSPIETLDAFIISAAQTFVTIDIVGEFICVIGADEEFDVYLNKSTKAFRMKANDFYRMPKVADPNDGTREVQTQFTTIKVARRANPTAANNTIKLQVGSGEYRTGNVNLAANVTNKSASTLNGANADVALLAGASALVIAGNANRRCVRIQNSHATALVRLSSVQADVDAGKGEVLNPGETREIFVTGAIYGKSASAVTLYLGEEVF